MDAKTLHMIERLRADPNAAASLLRSPDGQALLKLLAQQSGDESALERAAQNAANGSTGELARLLGGVLSTPQGKALAARISAAAGQK